MMHALLLVPGRLALLLAAMVAVMASGAVASPAGGQAGRAVPAGIEQQLAALDSEDYQQRQEQTALLLADNALTAERLAQMLAHARTAEQRHRLLTVARHHVLRELREQMFDRPDRGSLGISHRALGAGDVLEGADQRSVIEVVATLPGFPAYAQLQPGDRVVAINDRPLPSDFSPDHFREIIMNYSSGDTLTLTVERHGRELQRTIELASAQALGVMYDPVRLQLRSQFEQHCREALAALLAAEQAGDQPGEQARQALESVAGEAGAGSAQ